MLNRKPLAKFSIQHSYFSISLLRRFDPDGVFTVAAVDFHDQGLARLVLLVGIRRWGRICRYRGRRILSLFRHALELLRVGRLRRRLVFLAEVH